MYRDTPTDSAISLRMPPTDIDAECAVIAACVLDNDKIADVTAILPDETAFFRDVNAKLWRIILDLWADEAGGGQSIDLVTVHAEAERRGGIAFEEGFGLKSGLVEILNGHPLSWNAVSYAVSVRRAAQLRSVIETADAMTRDAYRNRDEPEAILGRSVERLGLLQSAKFSGNTETLGELMPGVITRILDRQHKGPTGVLTPWAELNFMTDGLQATDFVIVAARPSMGKTSLSLNLADFAAVNEKTPTLFVSLEMSNPLLAERMLVGRARVDGHKVKTGRLSEAEWERVDRARAELAAAPCHLVRRPGRTLPEVVGEIRRAHARHGIGLVIVDYLQQIRSENPRETEVQSLTRISGELKGLTMNLDVPIVALSQLNRNLESRDDKRPKMADIRGSGSIEQDADLVLLLHRPEYFNPTDQPGIAEAIVGKNRNNPTGEFKLDFVKEHMRFENHDPNAGYIPPPAEQQSAF